MKEVTVTYVFAHAQLWGDTNWKTIFVLVVYFASDEDLAIIHHIGDEGKKEWLQ